MSFPPLAGGDHTILSSEFCSGYTDTSGTWNTGFYCPQTGSTFAVFCCGTPVFKYCCTHKPNGTLDGNPNGLGGGTGGDEGDTGTDPELASLNLSDVPIIFGVACGVAAVLILVILTGFYLTSCCAHYHQLHQNRKRRSSMPGLYRGNATANTSANSGLVNLYSPTNSTGDPGIGGESQGGVVSYPLHRHTSNPPASPSSSDHYQMGPGASLVTTPLDIEWSSTTQYLYKPHSATPLSSSQPLNLLSQIGGDGGGGMGTSSLYPATSDHHIQYTVHQTQNRLAVALSGSMNRLSDRASPMPSSGYPVNIPLTPPDGYSYPRQPPQPPQRMLTGGGTRSPPPQYNSSFMSRSESPPYYPYDSGSSSNTDNQQKQLNYLNRTSTLPLSLTRKPPTPLSSNRPGLTSPGPYLQQQGTPLQPKSILRTSQNYRRVVINDTPPPVPPHISSGGLYGNNSFAPGAYAGSSFLDGGGVGGSVAYRNIDSRTNLNQPVLLLENKIDNHQGLLGGGSSLSHDEDDDEVVMVNSRRGSSSSTTIVPATTTRRLSSSGQIVRTPEEEEESRDHFDINDIDSDALSRLIELDLDSKL